MDTRARRQAETIARGAAPEAGAEAKTAFYGFLGRLFAQSDFQGMSLERAPSSFGGLHVQLHNALSRRIDATHALQSTTERTQLHNSGFEYLSQIVGDSSMMHAPARLEVGVKTAVVVEMTTLRTLAKKIAAGEEVSEDGLYKSRRVPFAHAMTHLPGFNSLFLNKVEPWSDTVGDKGEVFKDDEVLLEYGQGLSLAKPLLHGPKDIYASEFYGPAIGCPITLVKGAMEAIHRTAVNAALEAELLVAS